MSRDSSNARGIARDQSDTPLHDGIEYFSPDYVTARERFRTAARAAGATLHTLDLDAKGPGGEALSIDIAWLGSQRPDRVFLHTCGLHGVEAYTGSAVQLAFLEAPPALEERDAWILVHVLNPFGMAWLRRTNENNVDLNRNFLLEGEVWSGAPELYRVLDPLLNPQSPPARDFFALRAAALAMRYGFHRVKQAVAEGQYEFPRGLFYGGNRLQQGPRLYLDWLTHHLRSARHVFALDLHTGLGPHATDTIIPDEHTNATSAADLSRGLGRSLVALNEPSVAYTVRGGFGAVLPKVLHGARTDFIVQEIGTYPALKVLRALREENRWHYFGRGSIVHPAKQHLREALCPRSSQWRRRAVALGLDLARRAARMTFEKTAETAR